MEGPILAYNVNMVLLIKVSIENVQVNRSGMSKSIMLNIMLMWGTKLWKYIVAQHIFCIAILWTTYKTSWSAGLNKALSYFIRPYTVTCKICHTKNNLCICCIYFHVQQNLVSWCFTHPTTLVPGCCGLHLLSWVSLIQHL